MEREIKIALGVKMTPEQAAEIGETVSGFPDTTNERPGVLYWDHYGEHGIYSCRWNAGRGLLTILVIRKWGAK